MEELSLIKRHDICVEILNEVDVFCKNYDIQYFIGYGTLLGAIRHKGFIPWDDDIDILMFRSEYDKFVEKFSSEKYELYDFNKPGVYVGVSKIADKTTILKQEIPQAKINIGVSIDLFILDYEPDEEKCFQKIADSLLKKRQLMIRQRYWLKGFKLLSSPKQLLRLILFSLKNRCFSLEKTRKDLNQLAQSVGNEKTNYVGCLTGASDYTYKERYDVEWFNKTVEVEFEGKMYPAPYRYEEYLKHLYGDYMKLPPEDKRYIHTDAKYYFK